ncbi:hypothetical protein DERP_006682 [Dermatophagoides pteronyssinus]|uniref:Uncharacterized protein n=1 Tax=Dermatophagoides pteronyssinus TaxID=6956 RepID=A0ABQ8IQW1_DERPT|nr:hypothetical protein DERP_006682 [Dermatophagoides pteronyssinus]
MKYLVISVLGYGIIIKPKPTENKGLSFIVEGCHLVTISWNYFKSSFSTQLVAQTKPDKPKNQKALTMGY